MRVMLFTLLVALSACQPAPTTVTAYDQLLLEDCRSYLSMQRPVDLAPAQSITPRGDLLFVRLGDWTDARTGAVASCSYHRTEHRRVAAVTIVSSGDETYTVVPATNRPPTEGLQ